jgi:hypothetical protein
MTGPGQLEQRARALEQLARRFRVAAERSQGPRADALREESRDVEAEALRFTQAAAGSRR